jgi:hypothetical protein
MRAEEGGRHESGAIPDDGYGPGSDGPPVALALRQAALAFPADPLEDPAAWQPNLRATLHGVGGALRSLASATETLAADETGGRARFAERLAAGAGAAGTALAELAGEVKDRKKSPTIGQESAEATAHAIAQFAGVLRSQGQAPDVFTAYGRSWTTAAGAISDLLSAASARGEDAVLPELLSQYNASGAVVRGASLELGFIFYAALPVNRAIPAGASCAGCPQVGCTTYCRDDYSDPTGCSSWTLKSGTRWTYEITCTWTVTSIQKDVCACYRGRWDRFWAWGACDQWVTQRVTGTKTVSKTTEQVGRWGPPFGDPSPFSIETSC